MKNKKKGVLGMEKEKKRSYILCMVTAIVLCILLSISPLFRKNVNAASGNTISLTLYTDNTMQLYVGGTIKSGNWKSSNTKIATVSKKGLIKTKNKAGKAVITVKIGKQLYQCNLTVKKDNSVVKLDRTSATLNGYNKSVQLKASVKSKKKIYFRSTNTSVAKVSSKGLITPVRNGKCDIIAYVDDNIYRSKRCSVTVKNCPVPAAEKTKYNYKVYVLDELGEDGWFNLVPRLIYIKTNNPNMDSIDIFNDNFDVCASNLEITGYADLDYSDMDSESRILKVSGGYLMNMIFCGEESLPSYTGYIVLKENNKIAANIKCTVHDVGYMEKQAVKKIVRTVSKEGMTPFDKMQAAVDYIESKNPRYYWNDGMYLYRFATDLDDCLWFYHWRFDSLVTPTVLCEIAEEIGGFDKISNLYYEGDWSEHWYAKVTIGKESRRYTFCPMSGTGYIKNPTEKTLSFSDISKYTRIY